MTNDLMYCSVDRFDLAMPLCVCVCVCALPACNTSAPRGKRVAQDAHEMQSQAFIFRHRMPT